MRTILLVDDSRVTRELLKVYLIAHDVTLLEAADGVEALAQIHHKRPDLIIADLRMPRLDGPGLCRTLQGDPETSALPVLILTSNRDSSAAAHCLNAGAREVLTKPIQPKPLLEAVRRNLEANPRAEMT